MLLQGLLQLLRVGFDDTDRCDLFVFYREKVEVLVRLRHALYASRQAAKLDPPWN